MDITIKAPASVPAGTYKAKFAGLEQKTSREGVEFWVWQFAVETPDGPRSVSGASSTNTGPKAKSYKWFSALLGRKPKPDEVLGTNLHGKPCLLVLDQDLQGYNDITDVLPPARLSDEAVVGYADDADAQMAELPF